MDWSNDMVLEFLHNFEAEPVIWDPKHAHHKKKHMVADAWRRLRNNLSFENSTSVEELKKKKDSLMAYYRIHLNKMKNIKKSGMGSETSYKTDWFAFSTMHSFLAPVYKCNPVINAEELAEKAGIACVSYIKNDDEDSSCSSQSNQTFENTPLKKKRKQSISDLLAKKQLEDAYSIMTERTTLSKIDKVHECDLYTQLLSKKLKKIDENRRTILMHNIDSLVFQELMASHAQERVAFVASSYSTTPSPSNQ